MRRFCPKSLTTHIAVCYRLGLPQAGGSEENSRTQCDGRSPSPVEETPLMRSSRFLFGFALAISLVCPKWSAAQFAPPPSNPPGAGQPPPAAPPPVIQPIREMPQPGDPALPAQLSDTLKSENLLSSADVAQVDSAVSTICTLLSDEAHPANQSACRDWIVLGVTTSNGTPSSAAFLLAYSQSLNNHLLALVNAPHASIRVKIYAGLVAAKVADASLNGEMMDLASRLMKDPSPAVVLVGIKAAAPILPAAMVSIIKAPLAPAFAREIEDAAVRNSAPPLGGRIANAAYNALEPLYTYANKLPNLMPMISQILVPVALDLEKQRMQLYLKGPPSGIIEDANGFVGLFAGPIWTGSASAPGIAPPMQAQLLQAFSDLVGVTAAWAASPNPDAVNDHNNLMASLELLGNIMTIFSDPSIGTRPEVGLYTAASLLQSVGPTTPSSAITSDAASMVAAISTFAKDKVGGAAINPPPSLLAANP